MAYRIIAADYKQAEPRVFAHFSGEKRLQSIFDRGEDFYSVIAIDTLGLKQYSANEADPNFLKKLAPDMRQLSKVFCFTESTMVEVKHRGLISIKDVKIGDYVQTVQGYRRVTNLFNRKAEILRVTTNKAVFKVTKDHPFWSETKHNWVEAGNLLPGELLNFTEVTTSNTSVFPSVPIWSNAKYKNGASIPIANLTIDEGWGWIIGAFLGDGVGCYTRRKTTNKVKGHNSHLISSYVGMCGIPEDGVIAKFTSFFKQRGYNPSLRVKKKEGFKDVHTAYISDFELVKIFQDSLNLIEDRTEGSLVGRKNLRIPAWAFNAPYSVRLAILAGLFDTDGYLKAKKSNGMSDAAICSKSQDLISDISNLLNSMGVENTISAEYNKKYDKHYFLLRLKQMGIYQLASLGIQDYMVVQRKIDAFINRLSVLPRTTYTQPKVLNVIDNGEVEEVYDITVDEVHEFIANGIKVHNCLAIPYGAEGFQIAAQLGYTKQTSRGERVDSERGEELVNKYLRAYPNLHKYMKRQEIFAKKYGYVTNLFGRVRRIPEAKELYEQYGDALLDAQWAKARGLSELRKDYKSALNVAKNSPIQSTAADIINRATIELSEDFRRNNLDASVRLQVHDEVICIAHESVAEIVAKKIEYYMCNNKYALMLDVKLEAEAKIGGNLVEVK